jgi:regulator of sigma D
MIRITVELGEESAEALAQMAKRFSRVEANTLSNQLLRYSDGQSELDHMMSAVAALSKALAKSGFDPA